MTQPTAVGPPKPHVGHEAHHEESFARRSKNRKKLNARNSAGVLAFRRTFDAAEHRAAETLLECPMVPG